MPRDEIRFGLRRYPLAVAISFGGGVAFVWHGQTIDKPTFVFPFGRLEAASASIVFALVGAAALLYAAVITYVRVVRRPVIALSDDEISIPTGEFGLTAITLRKGDVIDVRRSGPLRGGWYTCHVRHRSGFLAVHSSQVPNDEAFIRICERLQDLQA